MTIHTDYIGDYRLSYDDETNTCINIDARVYENATIDPMPTQEECNAALGTSGLPLALYGLFYGNSHLIASPKLPKKVYNIGSAGFGMFLQCSNLLVAPSLPKEIISQVNYGPQCFMWCTSLRIPAVIPNAVQIADSFYRLSSIEMPVSIPKNVTRMYYTYSMCTEMGGEFCIRPTTLSDYTRALYNTVKPITIYGDQALCEAVAATANNGNASWQPWYDPVPAVTDRGQGSYTTADDMTRMVRNGVLAVDSYAPGRMVYHQGDIVREDEWEALVEAAQTIDPTVTMSTHYTNLNKIEKAFDDAL